MGVAFLVIAILPFALTFFLPFQFVFWGLAFICAVIAVFFGIGSLYAFDVTDPEDWKQLAFSLLIPGAGVVLFHFIGLWLGDLVLMDVINMIFG